MHDDDRRNGGGRSEGLDSFLAFTSEAAAMKTAPGIGENIDGTGRA